MRHCAVKAASVGDANLIQRDQEQDLDVSRFLLKEQRITEAPGERDNASGIDRASEDTLASRAYGSWYVRINDLR
jgi:hypothetical protein